MQIILSVVVGFLLVVGQALWKASMSTNEIVINRPVSLEALAKTAAVILLQPLFILGCMVYLLATMLYVYVISKYNYGVSYAMIVACSTIFATLLSALIFKEKIYTLNIIGIVIIVLGIILVVRK